MDSLQLKSHPILPRGRFLRIVALYTQARAPDSLKQSNDMDMPTLSLVIRVALVLALLPVLFVGASLAWNHPPLFDTPGMSARLTAYFTTHVAETRDNHPFPELRPRTFDVPPDLLFRFSEQTALQSGWLVSSRQPGSHKLTAVATTRVWRFKDDITLQAHVSPEGGSILYVHSESRLGKGDLGANLRRVIDVTEGITLQVMEYKKAENQR